MYKMNWDRFVEALWDEDLKERIHEAYYSIIPNINTLIHTPSGNLREAIKKWRGSFEESQSVVYILAIYILEIEDPDPRELSEFLIRNQFLIMKRLEQILDREEIKIQIKRRGLLL